MALRAPEPFSRSVFTEEIAPFAHWLVACVRDRPIGGHAGWREQLDTYVWDGKQWPETLQERLERTPILGRTDSRDVVAEILRWGGLKPLGPSEHAAVLRALDVLDSTREGGPAWQQLYTRRIAAVSKIYATHDPNAWTIYDSRVGYALAKLVATWWREQRDETLAPFLRFPIPPARSARTVPGFPRLADGAGTQARLAFYFASWLCRVWRIGSKDSLLRPLAAGGPPTSRWFYLRSAARTSMGSRPASIVRLPRRVPWQTRRQVVP